MDDKYIPVITRWPLDEILNGDGVVYRCCSDSINGGEVRELLRRGITDFAIINMGDPIRWVSGSEVYRLWKAELAPHLADPEEPTRLEDFDDQYFYSAERWTSTNHASADLLVFFKNH